jgi:hypothetical protein
MRLSVPWSFVLCVIAWLAACSAGAPGPGIDTRRAVAHVEALVALGPHPGDSPAAQHAASYLEAQLQAIGARVERVPVGTVDLPAIDLFGFYQRPARTEVTTDPDLMVRFGPPGGRALLVMAHYDTVPTSPGAVDNAAGVAVVLELARVLATAPPPIPVMLVFTANEEIGLVGAEALAARRGDEIAFAIALDLIGGHGDLSLNGASRLIGAAELGWLASAADRAGVVVRAPLAHRVVSRAWPQIERSDHGPFTRRGIPAVHFYHRGQDGEWIDLAYHSERDVAARVEPRALDEIGRLLRALTATPPPAHDGDGFWLPLATNVVVPRGWLVALELGLAVLAIGGLVTLRTSRARGGLGLLVGLGCTAVALAVTAGIERATAGGHPAPWLHAPGVAALAECAIFAGVLGLATRAARRFAPWVGDRRYLVVAIALPLALGLGCLALGAAELAWIWLVPAACAAVAPRLGRFALLAVAVGLLPGVLLLLPNQLREAAWSGFWPTGLPLATWIAGLGLAPLAGFAWWLRKRPAAGPLGTLVLPLGCGLAMIAGVVVIHQAHPPCTPQQFHDFRLACEAAFGVR